MNKGSDLSFGFRKELQVFERLKNKYGKDIKRNSRYSKFDFETADGKIQFELKSRRFGVHAYPTTMISYHKLEAAQIDLDKKKTIFLFNFRDGLYEWEYNDDEFEVRGGGTTKRGCNELHLCGYIPIENLNEFST